MRRGAFPAVAILIAGATAGSAAGPEDVARDADAISTGALFRAPTVALSAGDLYVEPDGRYGRSRAGGFSSPALRFSLLASAMVPIEQSGLAFGAATSNEEFDAGGGFGLRLDVEVLDGLWAGGEVDFGVHDVRQGDVLFPGSLSRIWVLFPVGFDFPLGGRGSPVRLSIAVAPGLQIALPRVDEGFRRLEERRGRAIDGENEFVGLTLRAMLGLRVPLHPSLDFFVQAAYDWAWGEAHTEVRDFRGQTLSRASDEIDLSGLQFQIGFAFLF